MLTRIFGYGFALIIGLALVLTSIQLGPLLRTAPAEAANGIDMSEQASNPALKSNHPVLVELFTSQGCYSCPPAEAYLREVSVRPDVIALEYHVDYWDDLVYGAAGRWKDPYSSAQFTARQSDYNHVIRKKSGVYTPQLIANGRYQTVGSRKGSVDKAINNALGDKVERLNIRAAVSGNILSIETDAGLPENTDVFFVIYKKRAVTDITSGENKGKELASYNVVTTLGSMGGSLEREITPLSDGEHCAAFIQDRKTLAIFGAALCEF